MTYPIIGQSAPTPLYDLFEEFPDVPRSIIIKLDVLNWGINFTPTLNWIGRWTLPVGALYSAGTFSEEVTQGKVSHSDQEETLFDIPANMLFRDGTITQILIKKGSPYEIRYEGDGSYMLYWRGMAVEEVMFPPRPNWLSKKLKDGTPVLDALMAISDNCT